MVDGYRFEWALPPPLGNNFASSPSRKIPTRIPMSMISTVVSVIHHLLFTWSLVLLPAPHVCDAFFVTNHEDLFLLIDRSAVVRARRHRAARSQLLVNNLSCSSCADRGGHRPTAPITAVSSALSSCSCGSITLARKRNTMAPPAIPHTSDSQQHNQAR